MGNKQIKRGKNFFELIKTAPVYRDFVIQMNQIISRDNTEWMFVSSEIKTEELEIYWNVVENFFIYCANMIHELGTKD